MRALRPILYFRGQAGDGWRLSALLVREDRGEPAPLETAGSAPTAPRRLAARQGHAFWRYDFSLPLQSGESLARYRIAGQGWSIHLPALHGPRRLAYTACSGTEDEGQELPSRNALWRQLAAEHAERPFHLLLQGGDQLYADTIWDKVPELGSWRRLPWRQGNAAPFTPTMAEGAIGYYFDRYCSLWSQPELAPVLAAVPSVMMWDDHDIFDGWGSWPEDRQECPVFQGLGAVAREHFALFQLASRPDRLPDGFGNPNGGHFGCSFRAGGIGIIAPDLRSERSRTRIMGEAGWRGFTAALTGMADCRQVLVMSSVPLTNAELPWLERIFVTIPGHSDLEDDLRDQWQSFGHRDEWRRMLACLADF